MKTRLFLTATAIIMLSFSSCKKDAPEDNNITKDLANDEITTNAIFEDVFNTADYASIILDEINVVIEKKSEIIFADSCPSIAITHPTAELWPKLVSIDYGTSCAGLYGHIRAGKILIEVTAPRLQTGSKRTITFDNYSIDNIKVEGTQVLENMGLNNNQNLVISVKLTEGKLLLSDGKTIERTVDHQREWVAGLLTRNIWDDECLITGTATGKTLGGISYQNTIITSLHWKRVCPFIVSGVVKIERVGLAPFEINYGTGECDDIATITKL
jgi:hypothetical protein